MRLSSSLQLWVVIAVLSFLCICSATTTTATVTHTTKTDEKFLSRRRPRTRRGSVLRRTEDFELRKGKGSSRYNDDDDDEDNEPAGSPNNNPASKPSLPPMENFFEVLPNPPTPSPTWDPNTPNKELVFKGNDGSPEDVFPLGLCEGDCDSDDECQGDLICAKRDSFEPIPFCDGLGLSGTDYCTRLSITDESCEKARAGEVHVTDKSERIEYFYEVVTAKNSFIPFIARELDASIQKFLATSLVDCELGAASDVQGISSADVDNLAGDCVSQLVDKVDDPNLICYQMQGSVEVYLNEESDSSAEEIKNRVWDTLRAEMNGSRRRRLALTDPNLDIYGLFFISGTEFRRINGVQGSTSIGSSRSGSIDTFTATGIVIACFVFGVIAFATARRFRCGQDQGKRALDYRMDDTLASMDGSEEEEENLDSPPRPSVIYKSRDQEAASPFSKGNSAFEAVYKEDRAQAIPASTACSYDDCWSSLPLGVRLGLGGQVTPQQKKADEDPKLTMNMYHQGPPIIKHTIRREPSPTNSHEISELTSGSPNLDDSFPRLRDFPHESKTHWKDAPLRRTQTSQSEVTNKFSNRQLRQRSSDPMDFHLSPVTPASDDESSFQYAERHTSPTNDLAVTLDTSKIDRLGSSYNPYGSDEQKFGMARSKSPSRARSAMDYNPYGVEDTPVRTRSTPAEYTSPPKNLYTLSDPISMTFATDAMRASFDRRRQAASIYSEEDDIVKL